jgi:Ca-activated chloride channel family protein
MEELFITIVTNFHFLRPWWFLGLIPIASASALYYWQKRASGNWERVINPQLLPFLMQSDSEKRDHSRWLSPLVGSAWLLCCVSLAGPTWQQLPQPVHKKDSALVVILDLSPSMLAEDVQPNRLVRARYKLIDILNARTEGVVGLIVYSGSAHTVSPLTEDSNTIVSVVPVLAPSLLPVSGSNIEEALSSAIELAESGGYGQADFLLITDGIDVDAAEKVSVIMSQSDDFRLSILGVGTPDGAPIPTTEGGFAKSNGNVIIARLNQIMLQQIASNSRGTFQIIRADDQDIAVLLDNFGSSFSDNTVETDRSFNLWDDQGFWLIPLILTILLLSFRKGAVVAVLIAPMLLNTETASAIEWKDLWQTPDQQAATALNMGDANSAKDLFEDSQWRGSAAYRAGEFEQAKDNFLENTDATGHYNRGNALARDGNLESAIEAYQLALSIQPGMEDALYNRDLIAQIKEQQDQQNQDQQNQDQQNQDQQNQDQQNQDQQNQDQEQKTNADSKEMTDEEKREQQEIEQILRKVPDDPGGLLRAKFRYQSKQRSRMAQPPNSRERW